jgi:hypothetical protein
MSGNIPTITRTLVGHVDPTYYPAIKVDIAASVTTPANAGRQSARDHPVGWRWGTRPRGGRCGARRQCCQCRLGAQVPHPQPVGARGGGPPPAAGNSPPFPNGATTWQQAAISLGWGYGNLNPGSIQADSGNNNQLRQGIIGLINKGEPRKVDDWGALRAWAWGAGKLIDFFEKDSLVDAKQVGVRRAFTVWQSHAGYSGLRAARVHRIRQFVG